MQKKLTLEKTIDSVKLGLCLSCFWPVPKDAIKLKVIYATVYQYVTLLLNFIFTLALFNTARNHPDNPVIMAKALMFMSSTMYVVLTIMVYRTQCQRLKFVIFEMENYAKSVKPNEEALFQRYIHKCIIYYGGSMISGYLFVFFIIAGPISLDQPFPTDAEYPFDIYHQPMKTIIYMHQSLCALHVASHLCMNALSALLLWFITARFELLTEKLRAVTNIYSLMKCVQEHQKLLKYAERVVHVTRPFAFVMIISSNCTSIIMGLVLITDQPLSIKVQCIGVGFSGLTAVFMYTWPAEHLANISNEVGEAIYSAKWYEQSVQLRQSLQIVIMRAQKPIIIAIPGIMPSLSLSYYATYLSTIFSYITTLRIFMQTGQGEN